MSDEKKILRILHTSDWHIGRTLYRKKRYDEFEAFLDWLVEVIYQQEVDVLLVSGDIFDTTTPSNYAQQIYYRFLHRVAASPCSHVVVTAGNHDSPSFLNAPKDLLKALGVHVITRSLENREEEVIILGRKPTTPELIVCAVPYLRDADVRISEAGESIEDKENKLITGIYQHYAEVAVIAEKKREELGQNIPIVAMGHLFTAGGQTTEGDGVRELYVGSLAHVASNLFSKSFSYVALGHLHVPQKVGNSEVIRYSGSPLPMSFGEAKQEKSVCLVEFKNTQAEVRLIPVPVFQKLVRVAGDWSTIDSSISKLINSNTSAWLEVIYDGNEIISDLRERLDEIVDNSDLEILAIKNNRVIKGIFEQNNDNERLENLNEYEVFERCLEVNDIPDEQRVELRRVYREVIHNMHEDDIGAE